jgi:hypothetical protein
LALVALRRTASFSMQAAPRAVEGGVNASLADFAAVLSRVFNAQLEHPQQSWF